MARQETRQSRNERRRQRRQRASLRRRAGKGSPAEAPQTTGPTPMAAAISGLNLPASEGQASASTAAPIAMHDPVQPQTASNTPSAAASTSEPLDLAAPDDGQPRAKLFFESPTWHWPVFDPACCQECGRVIPMHETGWILEELILCEECFVVLDAQRTHRGSLVLAPAKSADVAPGQPSESVMAPPSSPTEIDAVATAASRETEESPASMRQANVDLASETLANHPVFELTAPPAYVPRVNFAGVETPSESSNTLNPDGPTLFEACSPREAEPVAISSAEDFFEPIWLTEEEIAALDGATPSPAPDVATHAATVEAASHIGAPALEAEATHVIEPTANAEPPVVSLPSASTAEDAASEAVDAGCTEAAAEVENIVPEAHVEEPGPSGHADVLPTASIPPAPVAEVPWLSAIAATMTFEAIDEGAARDAAADGAASPADAIHEPAVDAAADSEVSTDSFQLTSAPFTPRHSFASVVPVMADNTVRAFGGPTLFELAADAEPSSPAGDFQLTPAPFIFRPSFAPIAVAAAEEGRWHDVDAHGLFDARAASDEPADAVEPTRGSTETPPATNVEATDESPVIFTLTHANSTEPAQPSETSAADSTEAPAQAPPRTAVHPADPQPPAPAPLQLPALEFKARKRSSPQVSRPSASPLTFHHPVDVLLNELHNQHVDAQVWATLKRWRQMDPFHGEIEAMMSIAVELRDKWMARSDAGNSRRSTAG